MLHKVEPPDYYTQLEAALEFQAKVITFVCATPAVLSEAEIKKYFGDAVGKWFWERLFYNNKETVSCTHLKALIDYVSKDSQIGPRMLEAFEHDRKFKDHLEDASFQFAQRALPPEDIAVLKPVMVDFYVVFFGSNGFPSEICGCENGKKLNRASWNDGFWAKNRRLLACPACDDQRPAKIHGHITSQVNHFLPKESYPLYSIHPDNLVPVCYSCNSVAQGRLDPIDDHHVSPLLNTFHPYYRPAIDYITVGGSTDAEGVFHVEVSEKDGSKSRRVNRMVKLLDLEARWADRMESLVNMLIESQDETSRDAFMQSLQERYDLLSDRPGAEPNAYVYRQLICYILDNPDEAETLWDVIES